MLQGNGDKTDRSLTNKVENNENFLKWVDNYSEFLNGD